MCGLFGALSSSLSKKEVENVCFLGMLSSTRGIDSTGIAVLGRGKGRIKIATARDLGNSMNFLLGKEAKRALETDNRFCVMGHTRWATIGAVNLYNAHPIEEDGIVLCHNGSIDHFVKDKKAEDDSDSRELARRLSDPNRSLLDVLRSAGDGAYAYTWSDFSKSTINLVRNSKRPLSFMYSKAHDTLYWASEYWMLKALSFKEGDNNFEKPEWLASDRHWSFPFGSAKGTVNILNLEPEKPKTQGIIPHGPRKPLVMCRFCKKLEEFCICVGEKEVSVPLVDSEFKSMLYRGWNNSTLSIGAVAPRLKAGCASCAKPASPRDEVLWFHSNEFVCEDCHDNNPTVKDYILQECHVYRSSLVRTQ